MDATKILGTEQGVYAMDSGLAAQPEMCPHCTAEIPAGEQFCPKCGYQRGTWGGDVSAKPVAPAGPAFYELVAADGARFALPVGETVAGRGDVALRIDDGYISRAHAKFIAREDKLVVVDLGSSNGTFVNGERLAPQAERELQPGCKVMLGQRELDVVRCEPVAADAEATQVMQHAGVSGPLEPIPVLEPAQVEIKPAPSPWVLTRDGQPEHYLPFGDTVLGRKAELAGIVVRGDGYVSGAHCKLIASVEALELIDLGSTNGTYINDERCEPSQVYELKDGYALRLGKTDLAVLHQEQEHITAEELAPAMPSAEPAEDGTAPAASE